MGITEGNINKKSKRTTFLVRMSDIARFFYFAFFSSSSVRCAYTYLYTYIYVCVCILYWVIIFVTQFLWGFFFLFLYHSLRTDRVVVFTYVLYIHCIYMVIFHAIYLTGNLSPPVSCQQCLSPLFLYCLQFSYRYGLRRVLDPSGLNCTGTRWMAFL